MKTAYRIGRDFNFHLYAVLFLFSDFSVSRLFPLPDAPNVCGWQWQGFRAEYALKEEDSARNGIAARPFRFQESLY